MKHEESCYIININVDIPVRDYCAVDAELKIRSILIMQLLSKFSGSHINEIYVTKVMEENK